MYKPLTRKEELLKQIQKLLKEKGLHTEFIVKITKVRNAQAHFVKFEIRNALSSRAVSLLSRDNHELMSILGKRYPMSIVETVGGHELIHKKFRLHPTK